MFKEKCYNNNELLSKFKLTLARTKEEKLIRKSIKKQQKRDKVKEIKKVNLC